MTTNPPPGQPSPWQPPASGQSDPTSGYPGAGYPASGAGYPGAAQPYPQYPTPGDAYPASGQPYPVTSDPYATPGQSYGYPGQPGYQAQPDPYGANPYGANPYGGNPNPYGGFPVRPRNGLALASMIVSIVAVVTCGLILGPVGAIMGHVARRQINQRGEDGAGMALAGIIVGWIATAIYVVIVIIYIAIFAAAASSSNSY